MPAEHKAQNMNPTLVVMAAGMGSRYGGIKQIDTFGPSGEAIIDYTVYDALQVGFKKVVFIVRKHLLADVKEKFSGLIAHAEVEFVFQELDVLPCWPFGTGRQERSPGEPGMPFGQPTRP